MPSLKPNCLVSSRSTISVLLPAWQCCRVWQFHSSECCSFTCRHLLDCNVQVGNLLQAPCTPCAPELLPPTQQCGKPSPSGTSFHIYSITPRHRHCVSLYQLLQHLLCTASWRHTAPIQQQRSGEGQLLLQSTARRSSSSSSSTAASW
jgi:hypothetical protein